MGQKGRINGKGGKIPNKGVCLYKHHILLSVQGMFERSNRPKSRIISFKCMKNRSYWGHMI